MQRTNLFDRVVAAVSPERALKRAAARELLSVVNSGYGNYGANLTKKSMRGWMYYGGSPKEDIEDNINVLRQRSRDAYMGIPTAAAAIKTMRTNVVAAGLVPAPKLDADYLGMTQEQANQLQAQIIREYSLWADTPDCDAARMDNFYQLQKLAFISYLLSGDVYALLQFREPTPRQPYALRVQLIEADRVCSPDGYDRLSPCTVQNHRVQRIVQGVETDAQGAVIAYWICSRHPLERASSQAPEGMHWQRVEAWGETTGRRNILQVRTPERIGQVRGVPILAPVLEALKQMGRYTDAEITAAVLSAYFTVIVKQAIASDGRPFGEMIPPEQLIDSGDQTSIELGPGAIVSLNPGEDVQFAAPTHPNTGYDAFYNAMTTQVFSALEVPPEVAEKKFSTSYSAARGALNEFWRTCDMYREDFADDFCRPIFEEFFAEAVARERIQAPGYFTDPARRRAYMECTWNGPARTNLNPVQEVEAANKRVEAGFSTAQEETAQMTGGDYSINIRQRIAEAEQKREVDRITQENGGNGA